MADTSDLGSDAARLGGSSPLARTNFSSVFKENENSRTVLEQIWEGEERPKVKFPKVMRYRRVEATIYGKTKNYPRYRLIYYVAGERVSRHFRTYAEAKSAAEQKVREIANGSQAAALTGAQSRDALAALQRLENFRQSTGRKFSLLAATSEFVEALEKLSGRSLGEAVE